MAPSRACLWQAGPGWAIGATHQQACLGAMGRTLSLYSFFMYCSLVRDIVLNVHRSLGMAQAHLFRLIHPLVLGRANLSRLLPPLSSGKSHIFRLICLLILDTSDLSILLPPLSLGMDHIFRLLSFRS
jgi:hypothetical protein